MKFVFFHFRGRAQSAFTLLEVLFATLAFAIILAAIHSVFYSSLRLRERFAKRQSTLNPQIHALQFIKRDLRAAFFSEGFRANRFFSEPIPSARFPAHRLEFFSRSGQTREETIWSDVQKVEYYLTETMDPKADTLDLVRGITRNLLTNTPQPPIEQRLLSGLNAFHLNFFDGETWHETWDSELQETPLPKAVRVHLGFDSEESSLPFLTQIVRILAEPIRENVDDSNDENDPNENENSNANFQNDSSSANVNANSQTGRNSQ